MHKPTYAQEIQSILAHMDSNGEDEKESSGTRTDEEVEDIDVYVEPHERKITFIKRTEPPERIIESKTPDSPTPVKPQPTPYFALFACIMSLLFIAYLVTSAFILTFLPPSVTITLLTKSQTITATGTIQLQARAIPPITLSESQTVQTTGRGHQDASAAQGTITFYNGEFQSVTIPAGKALTGSSGVTVITDQIAVIPAANINPPTFGQVTVSAHALHPGSNGNIVAFDINNPCCSASVIAKNPENFTGGQDERNFKIATQADIANLTTTLKTTIFQSMRAALQTQQKSGEALSILPCSPQVTTDHQPGDEAATVHVTVSETCQGYAYSKASFFAQAATILSRRAVKELGLGYTAIGTIQVTQNSTRITNNIFTITFTSQGLYGYALTRQAQSHIKYLLAGKRKQDAERLLRAMPGIQQAVITGIDDLQKLPKDSNALHIVVIIPESS